MGKILIIGAGIEQVPAIIEARKLGHFVINTDMTLKAPGIRYADKVYEVSTTDIVGNLKVAKAEKIDGVMTICSETAVPTVAAIAEELNLPGFNVDTARKATNKAEMREALLNFNVKVSPFIIADSFKTIQNNFENQESGSWVIKPVDSSGQRGTFVVNNLNEIKKVFDISKSNSYSGKVMLDKLVVGPEIHVTMVIVNGDVHFLALSDRITLNKKYFGICIRHLGHSSINVQQREKIENLCKKSIKAINLENGVATCELILSNDEPVLMEIAIRVPGGYLREVAMFLSGVDIIKSTIWSCLGENINFNKMITEESFSAVSVKFISQLNLHSDIKTIKEIKGVDKVLTMPNIKLCRFHYNVPFDVPILKSSVGRFAAIIAVGKNRDEAKYFTEEAFNNLLINGANLIEYSDYNPNNIEYN